MEELELAGVVVAEDATDTEADDEAAGVDVDEAAPELLELAPEYPSL